WLACSGGLGWGTISPSTQVLTSTVKSSCKLARACRLRREVSFFTLDLYHRFNSPDVDEAVRADADWEAAIVQYKNYLQTYRDDLPPGAKKLAEEVNLHDAEVLGIDFEYLATSLRY